MKKNNFLHRSAIKFRKIIGLKSSIFGLLALSFTGFSGCAIIECTDGPVEPSGVCNTMVTVESNSCWISAVDDVWFRTDKGELLMPSSSLVNLPNLQPGMRLKIAYETVEQNPQNVFTCNFFAAAETPEQSIKITCAEPLGFCGTPVTQDCNITATAEQVVCGAGVWANIWLRLDDGTLLQPWENLSGATTLTPGQRYKIGFETMQRDNRYQNAVICQAVPPVAQVARIVCLEADLNTTASGK